MNRYLEIHKVCVFIKNNELLSNQGILKIKSTSFGIFLPSQPSNYNNSTVWKSEIFLLLRVYWGVIGEGNGNPLQYSCLENSMDRGAW